MMEGRRLKPTEEAFLLEQSEEGEQKLPKFIQCKTCGNVFRREGECWYCPKPVKKPNLQPVKMGGESWADSRSYRGSRYHKGEEQ